MKVQIIQLEAEDDHVSTRDRISWARADKAVLVWPRSGRPLARRLDLTLVQRHAQRLGIELALVSFDPEVIASAGRLGLPVFESLEQLPSGSWRSADAPHPSFKHRPPAELDELRQARDRITPITSLRLDQRGRIAAVAVCSLAMLAVAVAVIPGADIGLEPTAGELNTTIELTLDPELQAPNGSDRLPASRHTVQVSGQLQAETTGISRAPAAAASGEVEITSLSTDPLDIPAGTGLRAGEVRFLTSQRAELEDEVVSVPIVAAEPGRAGNVAAERIDSVEGSLGFLVRVTNPLPTRGGRDVTAEAVSEDDRLRLNEALVELLLAQAEDELGAALGSGRALAPGTVRLGRVIEQQFDRQAGELASTLSLRMTIEVEMLSFDSQQAEQALAAQLAETVPAGRFVVPGSLVFSPLEAELDGAGARLQFRVRAHEARQLNLGAVRRAARGASAGSIAEVLETRFRLAEPAAIELRPSWLPWMPLLEMRIGVDWVWNRQ